MGLVNRMTRYHYILNVGKKIVCTLKSVYHLLCFASMIRLYDKIFFLLELYIYISLFTTFSLDSGNGQASSSPNEHS